MARKGKSRKARPEETVSRADETPSRASGDAQGLATVPQAGPESVAELVQEGQAFEAGIIQGVENAPDPDKSELKTHEVPEDDVPMEYIDSKDQRDQSNG